MNAYSIFIASTPLICVSFYNIFLNDISKNVTQEFENNEIIM